MSRKEIDQMVLAARHSYHAYQDVAAKKLNGDLFERGDILEEISIVDFYRYHDVPLSELYQHLEYSVGWLRPMDTGRSTNCLINDAGIFVHQQRRGHHNYALPYSWDVRLGHKTWQEAVSELNDDIDEDRVQNILDEIGFDEPVNKGTFRRKQLVLYFVASDDVSPARLRRELLGAMPKEVLPDVFHRLADLPLSANGKVDTNALPTPNFVSNEYDIPTDKPVRGPQTSTEKALLELWCHVLKNTDISVDSNFYDIGGESLSAIQIATQSAKAGLPVTPQDIFKLQTVAVIAKKIDSAVTDRRTAQNSFDRGAKKRLQLSDKKKAALAAILEKQKNG
jgi:hypothetical protein